MDASQMDAFKVKSANEQRSMSAQIRWLIARWLEENE